MQIRRFVLVAVLSLVAVACSTEVLSRLGRSKDKSEETDGNARNLKKKRRPSPEGFGVETAGPQLTINQVGPQTCPKLPGTNGSLEERFYVPDGPARAYVDKNGTTRLIIPHLLTYAWTGKSLEDATLDCSAPVSISRQDPDPDKLDDQSWLWAVYRLPDGRAMALNHMEYHPRAHPGMYPQCPAMAGAFDADVCKWYSAITWSIAEDGVHFNSPPAPDHVAARAKVTGYPQPVEIGYSDHSNIMKNPEDGKYYVAVMPRGLYDSTEPGSLGSCMMRSDDLTNPASWKMFTDSGWDGDARGGTRCKNVLPPKGGFAPGSLTYSTFYKRFVYLTFAAPDGRDDGFYMFVSKNNELTEWTDPIQVLDARLPWGTNGQVVNSPMEQYPSFLPLTPTADNFDVMGEEAYLYWTRNRAQDVSGIRDVMRVKVRFLKDQEEIENPSDPMKGFYRVDGGGHYSNGVGYSCGIGSPEQLVACGWTAPFNDLPEYASHGSLEDQGQCQCGGVAGTTGVAGPPTTSGCYRIADAGYFSNGIGQSCTLLGPNLSANCGTADFNALPARDSHAPNVANGACILPTGCYRVGPGGFFSNGQGQSCPFLGSQMPGICGTGDFTALKDVPTHGGNIMNPACAGAEEQGGGSATPASPSPTTPAILAFGCYRIGPAGYFSNGGGQSCALLGPNLQANCGTSDFNALTARSDHGGNAENAACILPQGCYRIGGGGFYSNGQGASCAFLGSSMQAKCGTTDFNSLKSLPSHGGNHEDPACP